jgi:hypothetical protein
LLKLASHAPCACKMTPDLSCSGAVSRGVRDHRTGLASPPRSCPREVAEQAKYQMRINRHHANDHHDRHHVEVSAEQRRPGHAPAAVRLEPSTSRQPFTEPQA